jgi:sugar phosphate isomerase/epimerase
MSTRTNRDATSVAEENTSKEQAQPSGTAKRSALQGMQTYRIAGVVSALIAVFVIFTILEPSFIKYENISEIVVQSSIIAVVALGMTLVIVTGGIDLSVGSIVAVVSVVRWPSSFARGAFTADDPAQRAAAVQLAKEGVDTCRAFGADHVVLWPAHDGYEYPFQLDYPRAWEAAVECYAEVARYAGDIDISIEYKPAEPRSRTLLSTTGSVLALIAEVAEPNLHATLDFAHMLMAGENAAQSIAVTLGKGHLRGLQLNDGYAKADDGLMVGAVHVVETLEAFFYLVRDNYQGTYYFDTDPIREDPQAECEENIVRTKQLLDLARQLVASGEVPNSDAVAAGRTWWKTLVTDHAR